jgi:hypothetical protein
MRLNAACVILIGLCTGCVVSTIPANDLGFTNVSSLNELDGCYQNLGETKKGEPAVYLSSIIWQESGLDAKAVEAVKVEAVSSDALKATALAGRRILRQETFVADKDFVFASGQITLRSKTEGSTATPAGNVFVGVFHNATTLGIDAAGNGRVENTVTAAGTVFLVIPIAGHTRDAVRFMRSPQLCAGS